MLFTVSPSPATAGGTTTADGWSIAFDRVVVGIGHASLGDDRVTYGEARYDRVLDVTQGAAQKLGTLYGLGSCDVGLRVSPPADDALLGAGVSEDTKTLMRTPGSDAYLANAGITLLVDGHASSGGESKSFHWTFRQRFRYDTCSVEIDGSMESGVNLTGNAALTYDIAIAPETLLLDDLADTAAMRFTPFALADGANGDADGDVSLSELAQVQLDQVRGTSRYSIDGEDPGDAVKTLADWVYLIMFPRVPKFRNEGTCAIQTGGGHHD